jgi:hypothetical protein
LGIEVRGEASWKLEWDRLGVIHRTGKWQGKLRLVQETVRVLIYEGLTFLMTPTEEGSGVKNEHSESRLLDRKEEEVAVAPVADGITGREPDNDIPRSARRSYPQLARHALGEITWFYGPDESWLPSHAGCL